MDSLQIADMEMPRQSRTHKKKRQTRFKTRWVKLSWRWVETLRQSESVNTYRLAHTILVEAFKREQVGGEIVLSAEVTGMPSSTRIRATKELAKLGLIKVSQTGRQAFKVVRIYK